MLSKMGSANFFIVFVFAYSLIWFFTFVLSLNRFPISHLFADIFIYAYVLFFVIKNRLYFYFDVLFVLFFPFYFKISFILYFYANVSLFELDIESNARAYVFCQLTWLLCLIVSLLRPKITTFDQMSGGFFKTLNDKRNFNNIIVPFIFALTSALFFLYQAKDVLFTDGEKLSRLEITELVGHTGWYLKYFIIAYGWVLALYIYRNYSSMKFVTVMLLLMPVVLYFFYQQAVGGRRELVFIMLFFVAVYIIHVSGVFRFYFYFSVFSILLLLIFAGTIRDFGGSDLIKIATDSLGEFLFPISTFQVYFNEEDATIRGGLTYLYSFTNFVPKAIFESKPVPLATEFALKVAGPDQDYILGYAITPITEAFLNFGLMAFIALPVLLSLISIFLDVYSRYFVFLPLILFSQMLNFQRSDLSSTAFEIISVSVIFIFYFLLMRFRISYKRKQDLYDR